MYRNRNIAAIIPALNEEEAIGKVLAELPGEIDRVIVCDNGSTDGTAQVASSHGADVVLEQERGYGAACLRAMAELNDSTDIVLFLDADYSDRPAEAVLLLDRLIGDDLDLVIGSRMQRAASRRALTPVARFGNWLSTRLIRSFWGYTFTDLGPFRAVTRLALERAQMRDRNFGWTVELQIRSAKLKMKTAEVPVSYRQRIGTSKISGTVMGSFKAGTKILYLIFRELFTQ
ncbi:MAG: glycosyltransferase family 2 protein [Candidatus Zixiibacteriota bacterium]